MVHLVGSEQYAFFAIFFIFFREYHRFSQQLHVHTVKQNITASWECKCKRM